MKTRKLLAILLVIALAAMLCVSAFAETAKVGTPENSYLTKYLQVADGVTVPAGTTFTFTATRESDSANPGSTASMPAGGTVEIPYSAMTASATTADTASSKVGKVLISQFFAGQKFDHAGVYTYTVTENAITPADGETWTQSNKTYTLRVYVKNDDSITYTVQDGTGEPNDGENGNKVDPTVQDPTAHDDTTTTPGSVETDGFSFTNKYAKTISQTDDDGLFNVTKTIAGEFANKKQAFPFTVVLDIPAEATEFTTVTYYLNGTEKTATVSGNQATITENLADAQNIVFKVLPAGTKFTVSEVTTGVPNADKWTGAVVVTDIGDGVEVPASGNISGATGTVKDTDTQNTTAFTNTYSDSDTTTPTGILMNNLPYIILLVVVIGGLTGYVVSKRRKEQE